MNENKDLNEKLDSLAESRVEPAAEAAVTEPVLEVLDISKKKIIGILVGIGVAVIALIVAIFLIIGGNSKGKGGRDSMSAAQSAFAESIGGVSETFKGTVSEENYNSADNAARAFVSEELSGDGMTTVTNVTSKGTLSSSSISALNIPEDILEGSDAVEEIEVVYEVSEAATYARNDRASDSTPKTKTVKVYVIKYGTNWKYFTPLPVTGQTISKSYYDSVFNYDKYKNCTFELSNEGEISVSAEGETMTMTYSTTQIIKYADGKVYLEQREIANGLGENTDTTVYLYLETIGDRIECHVKIDDGEWMRGDLTTLGFTSLEELTPFYDQYLDHTYFVKTDFGFALPEDNARKYFMDQLAGLLEEMLGGMDTSGANIDMYAEYYVSGGVLSGMRMDADFDWTINEDGIVGTIREDDTTIIKCTNYGTTVVESPLGK